MGNFAQSRWPQFDLISITAAKIWKFILNIQMLEEKYFKRILSNFKILRFQFLGWLRH